MVLACEAIASLGFFPVFVFFPWGNLKLNHLLINEIFKPIFNLLLKLKVKDVMLGSF